VAVDKKPEIMCNNIDGGNRKYAVNNISDFRISKYLHGFLDKFHKAYNCNCKYLDRDIGPVVLF